MLLIQVSAPFGQGQNPHSVDIEGDDNCSAASATLLKNRMGSSPKANSIRLRVPNKLVVTGNGVSLNTGK